jgi:predicted TIM-barrel fold metal-dependent hydrolase
MNLYGLKVIDFHSHFPVQRPGGRNWRKRLVVRYGEERADIILENSRMYRNKWRRMWAFEPPEEGIVHNDREQAQRWVDDMDTKGLERVNFMMGGGNDNLAEIVKMHPERFTGFAHHSLFEEGAAEELERAVTQLGLKGYKLIASGQSKPIDSEEAYPVWKAAEKLQVPVLAHFGVLGGGGGPAYDVRNLNPLTFWKVCSEFPTMKVVIPHFGACYWRELLQLCWQCPNVYVDTSGSNQWMRWMPYDLDLKKLFRKAVETIGPERLLFGTDSSYFPRGFSAEYLREQLKTCYELGLREEEISMIFHDNAVELLKL